MEGAEVFGIVGGTAEEPRVVYLETPLPADAELLALAEPVDPLEVFRFGAPCAGTGCQHFDEGEDKCRLVERVVTQLPVVSSIAPPCKFRPRCLWWRQEGPAACARCPAIVTSSHNPTELLAEVAAPAGPEGVAVNDLPPS
jgi:hypothetical protein